MTIFTDKTDEWDMRSSDPNDTPPIVYRTEFDKLTVVVTGGRDYKDRTRVFQELDKLVGEVSEEAPLGTVCLTIFHGGARGADEWADEWAVVNWSGLKVFKADWNRWGAAAGSIRNEQMAAYRPRADLCLAFHGGAGTADCVDRCRRHGIEVREIS